MVLFVAFLAAMLFVSAAALNLGAYTLQKQRLQSQADQRALSNFRNRVQVEDGTAQVLLCEPFKPLINAIGLPDTLEICVRSAAR